MQKRLLRRSVLPSTSRDWLRTDHGTAHGARTKTRQRATNRAQITTLYGQGDKARVSPGDVKTKPALKPDAFAAKRN